MKSYHINMARNTSKVVSHDCPLLTLMQDPANSGALISIKALIGVGVIPTLFTIVANAVLLLTIIKTTSLHTPAYSLLAVLCSFDFLIGAVTQPVFLTLLFKIQSFQEPSALLYAVSKWSGMTLNGMSFIAVFYITIEKYVAICHPFFYQSHATIKRYMMMVALACCCEIILPIVSGSSYLMVYGSFTLLSVLAILFCYIRIYHVIAHKKRSVIRLGRIGDEEKEASNRNREERSKTYTILILLAVFIASYVPPLVVLFAVFKPDERANLCKVSPEKYAVFMWSVFFYTLSSAINPVIYCIRMKNMKLAVKNIIFKRLQRVFPANA